MTRGRLYDLDFGPHEKSVRWIEDTPPASFAEELDRRLAKVRAEGVDALLRAAALSSARSVRYDGSGRMPHGLLVLSSARSLAAITPPEGLRPLLAHVLRLIHQEIHHPGFGPFRLLDFDEVAGEGKEGTLFSFLEAARAGETDWADHRFAWLVRNLERDQVVDLLLSSGLEGATQDPHNVVGVVESVALLQGIGWEHAPVLLRPIVRRQASGLTGLAEYEECRETVARLDLLRLARRRPPGQPAFGERDPQAFLEQAGQWAEGDPKARSSQISSLLAEGVPLEDAADLVALGAALLLLQETLRPSEGQASEEDVDRRVHLGDRAARTAAARADRCAGTADPRPPPGRRSSAGGSRAARAEVPRLRVVALPGVPTPRAVAHAGDAGRTGSGCLGRADPRRPGERPSAADHGAPGGRRDRRSARGSPGGIRPVLPEGAGPGDQAGTGPGGGVSRQPDSPSVDASLGGGSGSGAVAEGV